MATELEIKYAVNDLQLLDCILCSEPVASRMQAPFAYIRMQTTYYDTEDGALSARKCTYRLRKENGVSVITLKTPGEGYARGEWAWEGEYLDEAPEKLAGLGAPEELVQLLREVEPVIVCGAKFTRITALLHLDGADCEICGDIGSLIGGGRQEPLCELELELKSGSEAVMLDYAHALAEKYRRKAGEGGDAGAAGRAGGVRRRKRKPGDGAASQGADRLAEPLSAEAPGKRPHRLSAPVLLCRYKGRYRPEDGAVLQSGEVHSAKS